MASTPPQNLLRARTTDAVQASRHFRVLSGRDLSIYTQLHRVSAPSELSGVGREMRISRTHETGGTRLWNTIMYTDLQIYRCFDNTAACCPVIEAGGHRLPTAAADSVRRSTVSRKVIGAFSRAALDTAAAAAALTTDELLVITRDAHCVSACNGSSSSSCVSCSSLAPGSRAIPQ